MPFAAGHTRVQAWAALDGMRVERACRLNASFVVRRSWARRCRSKTTMTARQQAAVRTTRAPAKRTARSSDRWPLPSSRSSLLLAARTSRLDWQRQAAVAQAAGRNSRCQGPGCRRRRQRRARGRALAHPPDRPAPKPRQRRTNGECSSRTRSQRTMPRRARRARRAMARQRVTEMQRAMAPKRRA